jgi:hypothetical protein
MTRVRPPIFPLRGSRFSCLSQLIGTRIANPPSQPTVRRKLLRQNRDLARANSSQSLRIRHLENEYARMLSENLELRGRILQLETEAEDSKAQRVADHALEIKAKLEAQLIEWGGLLASLGLEPPAKRRDQVGRRASQVMGGARERRSPRKSLRDLAREAEAKARDEGRLTPISEHKSYPRRTLEYVTAALGPLSCRALAFTPPFPSALFRLSCPGLSIVG